MSKRFMILFLVFSLVFFGASAGFAINQSKLNSNKDIAGVFVSQVRSLDYIQYSSQAFVSRSLMLYGQDIVRQQSPTPPQISRFYAYLSSTFYDVYSLKKNQTNAIYATKEIINSLYPSHSAKTNDVAQALSKTLLPDKLDGEEEKVLKDLLARSLNDGTNNLFTGKTSDKVGWEEVSTDLLISPNAGSWKRWVVDEYKDLQIPVPDANVRTEINKIKQISKEISNSQKNTAKYWLSTDGSIGVSGIWQDRLYDEINTKKTTEETFAKIQKSLAVALADATLEGWKIKYQYWTPKVDVIYPQVSQLVKPSFIPPYPSETAVLASTATQILRYYVPEKDGIFIKDAEESRDSGLWAGVTLDRDNQAGYELGKQIGLELIKRSK